MSYLKHSEARYEKEASAFERKTMAKQKVPSSSGFMSILLLGEDEPQIVQAKDMTFTLERIFRDLQSLKPDKCHYRWVRDHLLKRDGQPYSSWELAQIKVQATPFP